MRTAAILPVKRFALAKQRLGSALAQARRRELAATMVADVLDALRATPALSTIVVVTNEDEVAAEARAAAAIVVADELEAGQSPAARAGIARAHRDGAERVLLVPGDCPALDPRELQVLLGNPAHRQVVIVPDRHGSGTNALLLTPPDVITPSFGPGSRARHESLAEAAGASWALAHPSSLLLDVDTGEDLSVLHERLDTEGLVDVERAVHTRAWLRRRAAAPTGASG